MLTPRRTAQLALGAACFILAVSVTVLVSGSTDGVPVASSTPTAHIEPMQAQITPPLSLGK